MLKLYTYWRSTAAYRVRIALNYKQIAYQSISVHLVRDGGEQHKPEYRQRNPQGLVPTLQVNGHAMAQSMAILEYLEETYPHPALLPKDKLLRATARQLANLVACDIHPLNNLRVLKYLKSSLKVTDEAKIQWYHHWLAEGFKAFEALVSKFDGPYCLGEELSMADVCLIPQIYNANRFEFDMSAFPRLVAINDACLKLQAFQDALPEHQVDAE